MSLSRTHIAFLGIISIFTGIIAPGTTSGGTSISYLMTDSRWIAYCILIGLILSFSLAAFRAWKYYRIAAFFIVIAIILLAALTLTGRIFSIRDGIICSGFTWGWVFLSIGILLFSWSYRKIESDDSHSFSDTIDTVIGMMGGFALACIAGVIILSSLSFFTRGRENGNILTRMYGSGEVILLTGGIQSFGSFAEMPTITYDRGKDYLLTTTATKEKTWKLVSDGTIAEGKLGNEDEAFFLGGTVYTREGIGRIKKEGSRIILGSHTTKARDVILYKSGGNLEYITDAGIKSITYTGIIVPPIVLSKDKSTLIWTDGTPDKKNLIKNGEKQPGTYRTITNISVSSQGQNITFLTLTGGDYAIIRNTTLIGKLGENALTGSFQSNGSHTLYIREDTNQKNVYFDNELISKNLEDVRELFLEDGGGTSYAYFGRAIGEDKWCLFTRYKGNLCGLEGYMNPRISADGSSILFAGKKNGIWSIYRNSDVVVRDTKYNSQDITYDYAYYDLTNPRTYLFIEYDGNTGKYQYRKNGILLPGFWDDVSTEVTFGYNNHIITSAKIGENWTIIEL